MHPNSDLIELLAALNAEGANYLIVGGYALAIHGKVRFTKDCDIVVGTSRENAVRVYRALQKFGAPLDQLRAEDLTEPEVYFIIGREPNQIDIITSIDGVDFEKAWANRCESSYGGVPVHVVSKADLIANKEASGRPQDKIDAKYLRDMSP